MKNRWRILRGTLLLLAISAAVFAVQYSVFHDRRDTGFYLLQDLGFLPIQMLIVTVIIDEMFRRREKADRLKKMNMVIGVFFQEVGAPLLQQLMPFDHHTGKLRRVLAFDAKWQDADFARATAQAQAHDFAMDCRTGDLSALKTFLLGHRDITLRLLENPNLLEHETFTDTLWAVSHLTDEFAHRQTLDGLPAADTEHLAGDMKRAYRLLLGEWLAYVSHLRTDYPYLFSLVRRTNPYDATAQVEIADPALAQTR